MAKVPPKKRAPQPVRRLNLKAVAILAGLATAAVLGYFPLKWLSERGTRRSALAQAEASVKAGQVDLALRNLDRYTVSWPEDLEGLELHAKLLADTAGSSHSQILKAAAVNDQLIRQLTRQAPKSPELGRARRRLISLYLTYSDQVRQAGDTSRRSQDASQDLRYGAAAALARPLVAENMKDAEAHRLLALSLFGQAGTGASGTISEATEHFEEALRLDPGDIVSAERLARIDVDRRNDPALAEKTLDAVLKVRPDSAELRLIRYQFFLKRKQPHRARAELEAALALSPGDIGLLLTAIYEALSRNDLAEARRRLATIPAEAREDNRVRMAAGYVDLLERHPDEAIDQWRKGLTSVAGGDQLLTWRLAHVLIDLGRLAEARPLVSQYLRLDPTNDQSAMGRMLQAMLEEKAGHVARALAEFDRIRDKVPDDWKDDVQVAMGRCFEATGDEARALVAYRRATAIDPKNAQAHRAVARVLLTSSREPAEAVAEIERALAQAPDDPTLLIEVGRFRKALQMGLPADRRDFRGVEEAIARAEQVAPGDPSVLIARADLLATTGRFDRGVDLLAEAVEGPARGRPEVWLAYASGLERKGQLEGALKALERASKPDAAGDHASIRVARAGLLTGLGRAQAARDLLSADRDGVPKAEQPELAKALGDLLKLLGDRPGTRAAYAEWARLQPDSPRPGLTLMALAQANDDDEAARLGLEALRAVGGDQEPYGLASRVLEQLRPERGRSEVDPRKLDEADRLVARLMGDAPQLPIGPLLQGAVFEARSRPEEAIRAYEAAVGKDPTATTNALARLVGLLTRLKKFDQIATLRARYEGTNGSGQSPALSAEFGRLTAAASLQVGDKDRAEQALARLVELQPDNAQARSELVKLLDELGKPKEAEATIRALVDRQPNDPAAWLALVSYQAVRATSAEARRTLDRVRVEYRGERVELLLARCLRAVGDVAAATKQYDLALAARPDDMVTLRAVVEFDEATGRFAESETALRRALKLDASASWAARALAVRLSSRRGDAAAWAEGWALIAPGASGSGDSPEDRLTRAIVLARSPESDRRGEAMPVLTALAEDVPALGPLGSEARLILAQSMLDANRPVEAARWIAPVAEDTRAGGPILAVSVEALARAGRPAEARRQLDRMMAVDPGSPRLVSARAWTLQAEGKPLEAVAAIDSSFGAASVDPGGEPACLALHDLAAKLGQADAAARLAGKLAARWPRDAALLARHQVVKGDFPAALASCRIALEAGSAAEATRSATLVAVANRDNPALLGEVDAIAEAALARAPKSPDVLISLATLRHVQGRYSDEMALYRTAYEANPLSFKYLNNMAWTLSEGLAQYGEALARIDEAIRREGRIAAFLDTRGVILARLGRFDEAIKDLEESCKAAPDPASYFHLARTYLKAGKADDYHRCRDLALKAKFDPATLDPTDRAGLDEVMGRP